MSFRNTMKFGILPAAALLTVGSMTVMAQTSQGILSGVARDKTGASIPNAKVTITNEGTQEVRVVTTKQDGSYRADAIPPGRYTVLVESAGFDTKKATGVVVTPSTATSYDVALTVGKVADVVEVTAISNAINLENGSLTGVISANDIYELPIFSGNPFELATTIPGIQVISTPGAGAGAQGQIFSANGARPRANNFLIDGQEINDVAIAGQGFQPNTPGAYSSVVVLANSASAEYGRAGGAVVNLVTTRGSNSFHGSAYERYEGSGLNALTAAQRQSKAALLAQAIPTVPKKTRYDQHEIGFTAGGPIIKDKLFAFGTGQWRRYYGSVLETRNELPDANGVAQLKAIAAQGTATQAAQATLFGKYLSNYNYLTAFLNTTGATPYNSYPVVAQGCPSGTCNLTTALFQRPSAPRQSPDTQFNVRVDYVPRSQDTISVRFIHDKQSLTPDFGNNASLPGFDSQQGGFSELAQVAETHVFSPKVLNEFRVSETRLRFTFSFTPETLANPLATASPTLSFQGNGLPNLGPNQNFPQGRGEDLYQLQDTVGINIGKQAIRTGFDVGRQIEQEYVSQNALGTLTYANSGTYGSSIGEYLNNYLGTSGTATKTFGPTRVDPHDWRSGAFMEDDIKLTPELTLNTGIRYDFLTNSANAVQYPGVNPATALTDPITAVYKIATPALDFSPRFGFAYNPHVGLFQDGKTVFHAGFGVYFDSGFSNIVVNDAQSSPNAVAATLQSTAPDGLANANTLLGSITATLSPLSAVQSTDKNLTNPYTYQYNFGFERELPYNLKVTTNYVGSKGTKLFVNRQLNYFAPNNSTASTVRINPARGPINVRGSYGTSEYNSLQVEVSRAYTRGLTFRGAYTFSKDLDNASEIFNTFNSPTSYQADLSATGLAQEWGNSAWDHRHYFVFSYSWNPKGFSASNRLEDAALNVMTRHWTLSGVERAQSGPYSTLNVSGFDTNNDGSTANDRPILSNASAPFNSVAIDSTFLATKTNPGTVGVYYDGYAYNSSTLPAAQRPRTVIDPSTVHWIVARGQNYLHQEIGRDTFLEPSYIQTDVALEKGFQVPHFERGQVVLRAEVNNLANHNNINPVQVNVSQFGQVGQLNYTTARTGAGRIMYLWAEFKF